MFQFKQFSVDQSNCAMKINTDGVLLGALAGDAEPESVLDIGTGTGVIALMLAQRFTKAIVDAVEIDVAAAETASGNFKASPFAERITAYPDSFETYFDQYPERKYDLIISNPPFYIHSLKPPGAKKTLAKHADIDFFERLLGGIANNLSPGGLGWLIFPVNLADIITSLAEKVDLCPQSIINIQSYPHSEPHRVICCLGFDKVLAQVINLTIYKSVGVYTDEYKLMLKPYFIAF
jgi:tRNA1Val (adenine37-N6)-methyltransferase